MAEINKIRKTSFSLLDGGLNGQPSESLPQPIVATGAKWSEM